MFKNLISKWFGAKGSQPQAPKTFKQTKRSIFLNRYMSIIYFLVTWHAFGYIIISSTRNRAKKEGLELHEYLGRGTDMKRVEVGPNFEFKLVDMDKKES